MIAEAITEAPPGAVDITPATEFTTVAMSVLSEPGIVMTTELPPTTVVATDGATVTTDVITPADGMGGEAPGEAATLLGAGRDPTVCVMVAKTV